VEQGAEHPTLDLVRRLAEGLQMELPALVQYGPEGESPERLRQKVEGLIANLNEEA
jgi:hypothetical protein